MSEKHIVTAQELKAKAIKEVDIKGFEEGEVFTIKIRSLSLMKLVSSGKIPNQLMATAVEMFEGKKKNADTASAVSNDNFTNLASLIDVICESAMVEPTFEEVEEYLTDEQKLEIFQYTQGGLRDLNSFRKEPTDK